MCGGVLKSGQMGQALNRDVREPSSIEQGCWQINVQNGAFLIQAKEAIQWVCGDSEIYIDPQNTKLQADTIEINTPGAK